MRLFVTLLLMVVIPLKAMAALALPLVGMPQHGGHTLLHAAAHAAGGSAGNADAVAMPCHHADGGSASKQFDPAQDNLHECPHLAMPALTSPPALPGPSSESVAPVDDTARALISIALGVPQPPPTRLH